MLVFVSGRVRFLKEEEEKKRIEKSTYAYIKKLPSGLLHGSLPSCIPPLPADHLTDDRDPERRRV
jgi:hypothetical protein